MRIYDVAMREEKHLSKVICNGCGKEIPLENSDYFHGEKVWGYFSGKDGERDAFDLCEACYEKLTANFTVKMME